MHKVGMRICMLLITACHNNTQDQSQMNERKLRQSAENLKPEHIMVTVKDGQKLDRNIQVFIRPSDTVKHILTEAEVINMVNKTSEQFAPLLIVPDAFIPLNSTVTLYETVADVEVEYSLLDQHNKRIKNAYRKTFSLKN